MTVTYQVPSAVGGAPPVTVGCSPPSGSPFPAGAATPVTCTAVDAHGRTAACGFTVRIALAPKLQKTRFLAFGDSMTVGITSVRASFLMLVPAPASYPGRLLTMLAERYAAQAIEMDDRGVQGEKTTEGVRRLREVLDEARPEVVLLLEGANDLNAGGLSAIAPAESNMEAMVNACLEAGAVPLLATLPPQRENAPSAYHPEAVEPYNERLRAVARYTGASLVDVHAAFGGTASSDLIGADGLHPTEAGYQRMADAFFAVIKATLEVPAPAPAGLAKKR